MSDMHHVAGNVLEQLFFGCEGGGCLDGQADPGGYAEYVCVYGHIWLVIDYGSDDIGCFAAYAGQLDQFFHCQRHFAAEFRHQHLRHADKVFGFVVGIGNGPDERKEVVEAGPGQVLGVRVPVKDSRGSHIDPFIGALRREDNGYQQLVGAIVC